MKTIVVATQGRRIPEPPHEWLAGECPYEPGDYWQDAAGDWRGITPNGLPVWLKNHTVFANEANGIITVTPSILANGGKKNEWHGYITDGVWREC